MTREDEIRARYEAFCQSPQENGKRFANHAATDIDYLLKENQRLQEFVQIVHSVIQSGGELSEETWQAYRPLYKPLENAMGSMNENREALQPKEESQ